MRPRIMLFVLFSLVAILIAVPALQARGKASTAPGRYKEWGPDIDQIEILKTFKVTDYDKIVVLPFDTTSTPLPDKSDKSYDTIQSVLASYTFTLVEALKPELKAKAEVANADQAPKTPRTLIVRGKVEELSPGSRAGRMMVGYGAGGSGTKLSGELVDASSGEVLLRFTQARRSGGTWKFAGGKDLDVMRDSIHAAGKDIAHILDSF